MKKVKLRRLLSILLIGSLVFSVFSVIGSAEPEEEGTDLPTVYVMGMGCPIITQNPDGTKHFIYPFDINTNELLQIAKDNIDVFLRAVATQQWDEFCDLLCETIIPYFEEFKLDPNGEVRDGSYPDFPMSRDAIRGRMEKLPNGQYSLKSFEFHYDFRLDPLEIADILDQYIRDVKELTGAEKVNLIGRCLGANIVAAYLQKYGHGDLAQLMFLSSTLHGAPLCSKAFCGEYYLDSDGIERYAYDTDLSAINSITGVEDLDSLLLAMITVFNDLGGLDFASWSVNRVLPQIYLKIFPRILIESFGTCPAFWSMVNDEDYEKAKETVFYGKDLTEYAGLIEKIDRYHSSVQLQSYSLLTAAQADGVPVRVIAKYGRQSIPVTDHADDLSDSIVFLKDSAFCPTTMQVDRRFRISYMTKAEKEGRLQMISPDRQIDASSCWFPQTTWFIKNLDHSDFPDGLYSLIFTLLNFPDATVEDAEGFPQFLVYDAASDQLDSMDAENCDTTARWRASFFEAFVKMNIGLFRLLLKALQSRISASES